MLAGSPFGCNRWNAYTSNIDGARLDGVGWHDHKLVVAKGQQRLIALQARGDVLDDNLYTRPGKFGGGGAGTTWLVGSAVDVALSLRKYQEIGITQFVLSDTPYLSEIRRQGTELLPLLRRTPNQGATHLDRKQFAQLKP